VTTLPPPPWTRAPQRPAQRRRDPLTQETIVDAALKVLDADGLDLLTMRHVARTLNATAGALYWHVGSKDGLLDLIFDRIIGEQEIPDPDPERWREQLKEVAHTMRAAIHAHRDVVRISVGRIPLGPGALRYADRVLAILRAGGLSDPLAVAGQQLLISIVIGFSVDETGAQPPEDAGVLARDYLAALPAERFPNLVALAGHIAADDREARFALLLDLFVDGLSARATGRRRPS
jgi:AcrR family transcriptional regulator